MGGEGRDPSPDLLKSWTGATRPSGRGTALHPSKTYIRYHTIRTTCRPRRGNHTQGPLMCCSPLPCTVALPHAFPGDSIDSIFSLQHPFTCLGTAAGFHPSPLTLYLRLCSIQSGRSSLASRLARGIDLSPPSEWQDFPQPNGAFLWEKSPGLRLKKNPKNSL